MKFTEPVDIMLNCCIPDKKRLASELSRLGPGDTLKVKIDNCITSRTLVERYVRNQLCRIVKVVDHDHSSVLHIELDAAGSHGFVTPADRQ